VDWETYGYTAGILNDGDGFRCNVGVSSWTDDWTRVRLDVQDGDGVIVASTEIDVPPFSHVQQRLTTEVMGGSLVFYLVDGPSNSRIFPYASIVDQSTGDPSYQGALASVVGVSVAKGTDPAKTRPQYPGLATRRSVPESVAAR
jgi:hypothetical protein